MILTSDLTPDQPLKVGSRASPLAKAQIAEVLRDIHYFVKDIAFDPVFITTTGDKDRSTQLRDLGKTDFFTKEIDQALTQGAIRIAIHSAKDLAEPLPQGLEIVAITAGQDPRDMLLGHLFPGARVGVSSKRREDVIKALEKESVMIQVRGTIEERIALLDSGHIDALVVPEAALIRLKIDRPRTPLPGETAPLQGQLAIVAREGDGEMKELFAPLDTRKKTLYLGLNPHNHPKRSFLTHFPVIKTEGYELSSEIKQKWSTFTLLLVTSQTAARWIVSNNLTIKGLKAICVGPYTAKILEAAGVSCILPQAFQAEGIIDLLPDFRREKILYLHSLNARFIIKNYLVRERFDFCALPIYDTLCTNLKPAFSLEEFDEFFFTSPSTVKAFIKIFKKLPQGKILRALGPITKETLLCHTNCQTSPTPMKL